MLYQSQWQKIADLVFAVLRVGQYDTSDCYDGVVYIWWALVSNMTVEKGKFLSNFKVHFMGFTFSLLSVDQVLTFLYSFLKNIRSSFVCLCFLLIFFVCEHQDKNMVQGEKDYYTMLLKLDFITFCCGFWISLIY